MDETLEIMRQYAWPGNIRELKSVINKILILSDALEIGARDLPTHFLSSGNMPSARPKSLEELEKAHIISVLEETGGNQSKAADILEINRKTLYKKIHKHRIFK